MKNVVVFLLLCFLQLVSDAQENIMVIWPTVENYISETAYGFQYALADNISLRTAPTTESTVLTTIPIGTGLVFYKVSSEPYLFKGIESCWYLTKYNGKEGWVWGGLFASYAGGSMADPSVKFLAGTDGKVWDEEWGSYRRTYQIRAVRNGKEIDKIVVTSFAWSFGQLVNKGNQGLAVDDILMLEVPCDGGCGCSTGDIVIFWDGTKFHHVADLIGNADGDYSSYVGFIFPSQMEGREGMIIKRVSDYEDSDEMFERKVILRYDEDTYWEWNGTELVDTGLPKKRTENEVKVEY